jgi:predicted trehalose synthase
MTPAEWAAILDLIHDLWPSAAPWPASSADRCYRALRGFHASTVDTAVTDLIGARSPSPAALGARVAERAASDARYRDDPALPDSYDPAETLRAAERIRGELSWAEWVARNA